MSGRLEPRAAVMLQGVRETTEGGRTWGVMEERCAPLGVWL